MDKSAPWTIGLGTLATSTTSAVLVGIYSAVLGRPGSGIIAGFAAFNSGITAATFFGIREYIVSPTLVYTAPWTQYARRRQNFGIAKPEDATLAAPSVSELRSNKLLDSGVTGAITGGLIRGWRSGTRAVVPGAAMATAACIAIQYGFNRAAIARLEYVAITKDNLAPTPDSAAVREEPQRSLQQRVMRALGIDQVSDEEYLSKLKRTREIHQKRIIELERQLEEEQQQQHNVEKVDHNPNAN